MKIVGRMETDAHKHTLNTVAVALLLALACMFFPANYLTPVLGEFYSGAAVRFVFGAAGILFMLFYGFHRLVRLNRFTLAGLSVFLISIAVALNNFPILPFINGNAEFSVAGGAIFAYAFFCLSIGFFEEIFFRGILLPLFLIYFKDKKFGKIWAVASSSCIFGLVHLVNLFAGASIGSVILQIGYSTLIGAMCAVVMMFCRNIWFPVILHTVYNVGGLMTSYDIINVNGSIWFLSSVILTAAVAVLAVASIGLLFKKNYGRLLSANEFKLSAGTGKAVATEAVLISVSDAEITPAPNVESIPVSDAEAAPSQAAGIKTMPPAQAEAQSGDYVTAGDKSDEKN